MLQVCTQTWGRSLMLGGRWDVAVDRWGARKASSCWHGLWQGAGGGGGLMPGAMQQPLHCTLQLSPAVT